MALANVSYPADGIITDYTVTFNYLDRSHVEVFVDGVDVTDVSSSYQASFIDDTTIRVTATATGLAVPNASVVLIDRTTPTDTATTVFADGSVVRASALNANTNQLLYIAQEVVDLGASRIGTDNSGNFDAQNKRIINLANPVDAQDAVNKTYLENTWLSTSDKAALNSLNQANLNTVAGNQTNMDTVAGIDANVTTVAGIAADVTTVAAINADVAVVNGIASDVTAVAADATDIGTVSSSIASVNTVAANDANVTTVAANDANVTTVAGINADVTTVAGINANVTTVAGMTANVAATVANQVNIDKVAAIDTDVTAVAAIDADVTTVAGFVSADISAVAANETNINSVASNVADVQSVALAIGDVSAVRVIIPDVSAVAAIDADVTTVAGINTDVTALAAIAADVTAAATNATDISAVAAEVAKVTEVANDLQEATSEIDTVATSIADVNTVGTNIAAVTNVANSIASVNYFGDTYFISTTAPSSPTSGDLWFDETAQAMKVYGSSGWQNAGSSVNGTSERVIFTVGTSSGTYTGSTTTFPIEYDAGYVDVWMNGIKLAVGDEVTATNGSEVVLPTAAVAGDVIEAIAYGTFELANFSVGDANDVDLTGATAGDVLSLQGSSYSPLTLSPVATSGAYSDLSGAPALATVATSGAYADLSGTPTLATVATSGAYADLSGTPAISAVGLDNQFSSLSGVTTSTSQPSGGSDGDIWLVVS